MQLFLQVDENDATLEKEFFAPVISQICTTLEGFAFSCVPLLQQHQFLGRSRCFLDSHLEDILRNVGNVRGSNMLVRLPGVFFSRYDKQLMRISADGHSSVG